MSCSGLVTSKAEARDGANFPHPNLSQNRRENSPRAFIAMSSIVQLTHRQQLVGTACVIIDAADHLHLHFKTPRAGNHVAHCRNGIDVTAFQNSRHHTQGWICLQYRPTRGPLSALKRKCRRHRAALRCPWLSPVSDAPLAQPYLPDRPDSAPRLCHRQQ